jgi:acyl-CoA synthetase (NDP forming)
LKLAREVTKKKPVVIMKVGRTNSGARAARSHTAALSGSDELSDAAFKQAGVIRVEEVSELIEVAVVLLGQPLPRGKKVAVLTVGGGLGVIAADALKKRGLEVPPLSARTMKKLSSVLSGRWSRGNPVDASGDLSYPCFLPLMEDENIDAVVIACAVWSAAGFSAFMSTPPWERNNLADFEQLVQAIEEESLRNLDVTMDLMKRCEKPVILSSWVNSEVKGSELYKKVESNYVTPYPTPDRAARALARLVEYSEYLGIAK